MVNSMKTAFDVCDSILPERIKIEYNIISDEIFIYDVNNRISYYIPFEFYKKTKDPVYFVWGMYSKIMEMEEQAVLGSWYINGDASIYKHQPWKKI